MWLLTKKQHHSFFFFFFREAPSSLKPKWHFSEQMEEAVMLFLGQEP